jgi:hypothetical protein
VFLELNVSPENELMQLSAIIADPQTHRLATPHFDQIGLETHRVAHAQIDAAARRSRIASDAPVLLLFPDRSGRLGVLFIAV